MARARLMFLVFALGWLAPAFADDNDKGVLASLISRALSSSATKVSIGAVDGAFSSDATVRDIVLSDRDGPWLKIDKARLVWTRAALLRRRLEVDQLEIGNVDVLRRPLKAPPDPKAAPASPEPILPDLPLKVIVKTFAIHQLNLGESLLGAPARLSFTGAATLGPPSEGLDLNLEAHRLDAAGDFVARLGFTPQSTQLSLALDVDEPLGGLIAHVASLPGLPPVKLAVKGAGPLDAFHAGLDFAAGPDIGAVGKVDLARQGAGRELRLDLQSRVSGLVPALISRVFAGQTALQGDVFLGDDSSVAVKSLHLVSQSARLDIEGGLGADQRADLFVHAGAIPGAREIGKLDLNARLRGPLAAPEITANFDLENLRAAGGTVGKITASFSARPDKPLNDSAARIALVADADLSGLALSDPARQDLIGSAAQLTFRGAASPEGKLDIAEFHLHGPSLDVTYAGEADAQKLKGRVSVAAPDLSRFARISGVALRGGAQAQADIEGAPDTGVYSATVDAKTSGLATGIAALDGFLGSNATLRGGLRLLGGGGFGFDNLGLVGDRGVARIDGMATSDKAAVHLQIDAPEAKYLDARVGGAATIALDLTGSLAKLDAAGKAALRDGRLMDRPTPHLELTFDATDILGRPDARARLDGLIDRRQATGGAHLVRTEAGGWSLDELGFALGSVHLDGALQLSPAMLADGHIAMNAGDLNDLSPLALTPLRGAFQSRVGFQSSGAQQDASWVAKSASLNVGANSIAGLSIDIAARDIWGEARLEGIAAARKIVVGGETVSDGRLAAKADATGSDLDVKGSARGLAIQARGRLAAGARSFQLSALTARGHGAAIDLAKPAAFNWGADGLAIDELALRVGGGSLALAGRAGANLNLHVTAAALPLSLADIAAPDLGLGGKLAGEATIRGAVGAPEGDWRVKIDGLTAAALRSAGVSSLGVSGSGRLGGGRSSLDVAINVPSAGALRVVGAVPLSAEGAIDLKLTGRLDLAATNGLLSARGQRAGGTVALDAAVQGDLAHPRAQGTATIHNASFSDEERGLKVTDIEAAISARGDEIEISRFTASTPHGGTLGAQGRVRLDPTSGFPGSLTITGKGAQLISTDIVTASAGLAVEVSGALARNPRISGRIDLQTMDISVPSQLSGALRPLDDTRHVDPGATARLRLAMAARAKVGAKPAQLFDAALALTVSAPSRIFLRGRGIDAEFGGELKVAGTTDAPRVTGGFDLRRGTLNLLGGQLTFTQGRVAFHDDAMPELDMTAQTTAADITAYINITGPAAKPVFAFTSSPTLPQDEILSRILFQKASGNLSAFQALQLANAVATLTGKGDAFELIRKSLGVDSFDVTSSSSGGPVVGAQRAINDRLSVGVKTGARPEDNGVSLDLDVTRHLRLQGGVDASGGSTVGVGTQWEY